METLLKIQSRYAQYLEQIRAARKAASPFAGFMGMGDDPRKHPCNMAFYEDIEKLTEDFCQSQPQAQEVLAVVQWILEAPIGQENEDSYWFLLAAQGHCNKLIPLLPASDCAALRDWYKTRFPRAKRLPVHQQLYKSLVQQAKKR